ncbi:MAG: S-adenosylhomocysteine deaminase [Labilithrix sp.]|nr:S-adenosylhomocysteine deaminase [Labilithrix sp.]
MRGLLGLAVGALVVVIVSCSDQTNPTSDAPPVPPGEDAGADAPPGDSSVSGDPAKGMLLTGTVLGESGPFEGQVLTLPDGTIGCAEAGNVCEADPRAAGVAIVTIDGVISPGLIDTHNHILFDVFDDSDWLPAKTYLNHDDWTKDANEPRYTVMVDVKQCLEDASQGKPTWCPTKFDGAGNLKCEMEKWGELKGLVAGTTSIVGLAGTALPCYASLARAIDTSFNGLDVDKVQTAAILPSKTTADGVCRNYADGKTDAYLIHIGEGVDQRARDEFTKLGALTTTAGCLYAPQTAITHGTSFTATEFASMKAKDMKLTWSPASNIALYGATTDIPLALDNGVLVSVAPDWSMGGSQNMLDELRFAKKHSDTKWSGRLSAQDLFTMATKNAAIVLGLTEKIGTIKKGMMADLFVVHGTRTAPYDAIVSASAKDVALTMVGGKVLYGDADLRAIGAGGAACETFDTCGSEKFLCVAEPGRADKRDQTYKQIRDVLEAAMKDIDGARPAGIGGNFSPVAPVVGCNAK